MKKLFTIIPAVIVLVVTFSVANPSWALGAATSAAAEPTTAAEQPGIVGLFGLDIKLFVAQLVNFAIVLFVLWKFVFRPVTNNMQARAKKIEDSLVNADRIAKEKEAFEHWKAEQMANSRHQAAVMINEAKQAAEKVKSDTLEATKQSQQQLLHKAKQDLEAAQQQAVIQAQAAIADMVVSSTEKLLKAKLDHKADSKIINDSLRDLERQA